MKKVPFSDLCEPIEDSLLPPLDRAIVSASDLSAHQADWRDDGYLVLKNFLPDDLIEDYCRARERLDRPGGWACDTPYLHVPELRRISLHPPLMGVLKTLISEDMGLHLNLTGWVSTQRNWHQDDYLNPPQVMCWYAAVWMALDDIDVRSGPFEFVPGSHKWPLTRRSKIFQHLTREEQQDPAWPAKTQDWISDSFEEEIARRGATTKLFLAQRGDILIWHAGLAHRGSEPLVPGFPRKALISHYSALSKRTDMPLRKQTADGMWYFDFPGSVLK